MKKTSDVNVFLLPLLAAIYCGALLEVLPITANFFRPEYILPDSSTYLHAAFLLYRQGFVFDPTRPFGYPLFIGLPYLFGAVDERTILNFAVILNLTCWLVSVSFVYKTLKILSGRRAAFLLTLPYILVFGYVYFIFQAMTELAFTLVMVLFAYVLCGYVRAKTDGRLLVALFLLCFSVVVRPITLYFSLAFFLYSIFRFLKGRNWRSVALAVAIIGCTVGLQLAMLYRESGRATVSFIQNYTMDRFLLTRVDFFRETGKTHFSWHSYNDLPAFEAYYYRRWNPNDSIYGRLPSEAARMRYWADADAVHRRKLAAQVDTGKAMLLKAYCTNLLENSKNGSFFPRLLTWEAERRDISGYKKVVGAVTALQNKLSCLLLLMVTLANAFGLAVRRLRHHKHYYCACTLNLVALYLYAASGISFWQADRFNIVWYPLLLFCLAFHIHWISKELQRYFLSNSKI